MLNVKPPNYRFCPFCGGLLTTKVDTGLLRKHCDACQWTYYPHVGASITGVIVRDGKVLMVKRRHEPFKGTWMFPSGFVEFGEHPEETAIREVQEETGLQTETLQLLHVFQSEDDPRRPGHLVFFYMVKTIGDTLKNDDDENEGIGWFDPRKPPEVRWKLHRRVLNQLASASDCNWGQP